MNYYPQRDSVMHEVRTDDICTSELVQRHLTRSLVVRAVNNLDFVRLLTNARPVGAPDRSALPVAADDAHAKSVVIDFLDKIGYDALDMGPLSESWRSEPTMPIFVSPYMRPETSYTTRRVDTNTFLSTPGRTVSVSEAAKLVKKAVRQDNMVGMMPVFAQAAS